MFCVENRNKLNYSYWGSNVLEGWKWVQLQSHGRDTKIPKHTVSSVGSTCVCLPVTLICIRNQMKDWKTAFGLEGRAEIQTPGARYLISTSVQRCLPVGCSHMVMLFCPNIFQVKLKTQAVVLLLNWSLFPICIMLLFIQPQSDLIQKLNNSL